MLGVVAIWLIVCVIQLAMHWPELAAGTFSDADDYMRLLQVRDWLNGQSWWDVTQNRMDPPAGGPMHWSRLVDLPIAAGLLALTPLLGAAAAQAVTVAIVPLAILGLVMAVTAHIARRLFDAAPAPAIAVLLVAMAGNIGVQMFPSRIDHHGWQILMAAVTLAALLDRLPLRSGIVAGLALAVWLNISAEGLPFAVAAAGAAALRWLLAPAAEGRRFAALTIALAAGSALLFVLTHARPDWTTRWCDAVTPAHLLGLAIAAAGATALVRFAGGRPVTLRSGALLLLAAGAAAAFLSVAPGCAASPFGTLDPLVHDVWYLNVLEGMPLWRQAPVIVLNLVYFPVIGLVGCALAWRAAATPESSRDWLTVALLLAASIAVMILVRRAGAVAHVMAVPGAIAVIEPLRARARRFARPAARAIGVFAAMCLPSPLPPIYASLFLPPESPAGPAGADTSSCDARCRVAPLLPLPPRTVLSTIDMGPIILALTRHAALAGPYHRSDQALADLIRAFTAPDEEAHAIIRRHGISYVLIDPASGEAEIYTARAPDGLMARLRRGHGPAWLAPVEGAGRPPRLWRVVG
jgi:hypothetical protein